MAVRMLCDLCALGEDGLRAPSLHGEDLPGMTTRNDITAIPPTVIADFIGFIDTAHPWLWGGPRPGRIPGRYGAWVVSSVRGQTQDHRIQHRPPTDERPTDEPPAAHSRSRTAPEPRSNDPRSRFRCTPRPRPRRSTLDRPKRVAGRPCGRRRSSWAPSPERTEYDAWHILGGEARREPEFAHCGVASPRSCGNPTSPHRATRVPLASPDSACREHAAGPGRFRNPLCRSPTRTL